MYPRKKKYCQKNLFLFWYLESHRREEDDKDSIMPVKALKKILIIPPFFAKFCLSWIRTCIINLKGECHEMSSFFEGSKPWNSTFWMSPYGFVFLWGKSCCAHETFRCFELCSTCSREGLGCSKPATNTQNKHINTTVGISTISKPYWTVFYRIKWALQMWVS
jgi:hypothetical protein